MKTKTLLTVLFCTIISTSIFSQSPWTQQKNKAFIQTGFSGIFYDKIRVNKNDQAVNSNVSDITTQLYAEYGILNKLDVSLIVPFKIISIASNNGSKTESLTGLGNVTVGLKYILSDKNFKISGGFYVSANTRQTNTDAALQTGYNATTILPYLSMGSSSGKIYYFVNMGYGYMTNNFTDFIKIGGEIGYNFIKKTHVIFNFELKKATNTESNFDSLTNKLFQSTALYIDSQEYLSIGLKLNHEIITNKFGVTVGAIGAPYLSNLPVAPSINAGVYLKL